MKTFKNKKLITAAIAVIVISSIGITTTAFSAEKMQKVSKTNTPALSGQTSAELQNETLTSDTQPLVIVDPTTAAAATPTATPAAPADISIDDDTDATAATAAPGLTEISVDSVKQIVLAKTPGAVITELELDKDDGKLIYEVKAMVGQTEYEYKIDAYTGVILKYETDVDDINDADDNNDSDDMDDVDEVEADDEDDKDAMDDKDDMNDINKIDNVDNVGEND